MEVRFEKLAGKLSRGKPMPVYLVCGEEPMQRFEAADQIRSLVRRHGYTDRRVLYAAEKGFQWQELRMLGRMPSLLAGQRLVELRLEAPGPGREGAGILAEYAQQPCAETVLLVTLGKLDGKSRRARWYQALAQAGLVVQCWPVKASALPDWLIGRAAAAGADLAPAAARLIAERTEGNLLAARQELDRLILSGEDGDRLDEMAVAVTDNARFDVFELLEASLLGDLERSCRMLRGLAREGVEAVAVFGALRWELRRLCALTETMREGERPDSRLLARHRIWGSRQEAVRAVLNRGGASAIYEMLAAALQVERLLKGTADRKQIWRALTWLFLGLGGMDMRPLLDETRVGNY